LLSFVKNAVERDPLLSTATLFSLYSSQEITAAILAAESESLRPTEAAAYFVFVSAAVHAELRKREGFLQRLRAKFRPQAGSVEAKHLALTNYVLSVVLKGNVDGAKAGTFANRYQHELSNIQ